MVQVRHRLRQHVPTALQRTVRDDQSFHDRGRGGRRNHGHVYRKGTAYYEHSCFCYSPGSCIMFLLLGRTEGVLPSRRNRSSWRRTPQASFVQRTTAFVELHPLPRPLLFFPLLAPPRDLACQRHRRRRRRPADVTWRKPFRHHPFPPEHAHLKRGSPMLPTTHPLP